MDDNPMATDLWESSDTNTSLVGGALMNAPNFRLQKRKSHHWTQRCSLTTVL